MRADTYTADSLWQTGSPVDYKDYYQILGVPRDADSVAVKRAYRALARQYHPDLNAGNPEAAHKFKEVNEAYTVLSDAEKRRVYDQFGADWKQAAPSSNNFNWSGWFGEGPHEPPRRRRARTSTEEFGHSANRNAPGNNKENKDDTNQSPFSDFFQHFFNSGNTDSESRGYTSRISPSDRHEQTLPIEITLEEAFWGATRTIQQGHERFEISIPRGVKSGSKVRIARGPDLNHLHLLVEVKPHDHLTRDGDNLHAQVKIDLYTALLGGEIGVPTLEGTLLLVVPSNTQNGRTFRLKGQGMPSIKSPEQRGDLYAEICVELPVPLTEEERRRYVELRRLRQGSNDLFS
ncbi:MAG: J domain-containing protein [Caldilineaceae bacterium]|nr:J domain-containing protein [Caldilineaceae bacterium]